MKIVIVGGGSAGWITASYLIKNLNCQVDIITGSSESMSGVGESTTPTILKVVNDLKEWKNDANAIIKYGIKFNNWNVEKSVWYHLFEDAFIHDGEDSIEYILKYNKKIDTTSFNKFHGSFIDYCNNGILNPMENSIPGYGYHIQADKLAISLKKQLNNYVEYKCDVNDVIINDQGIDHLILSDNRKIYGDYFIDCTGFNRTLISKLSEWKPYTEMIANRYIVGEIEHKLRPYTVSTATKHGWIWETDTQGRTNSGFVYNSDIISDDEARRESGLYFESRSFDSGKMKDVAVKNCISSGLAQSFIEPLEATSIMMTITTVEKFVDVIKRNKKIETLNKIMNQFIEHTKEFVRYHYVLSKRKDSEWWKYWTSLDNDIMNYFQNSLKNKRYCKQNDTLLNHYSIASMMVGYERI